MVVHIACLLSASNLDIFFVYSLLNEGGGGAFE